MEYITCPRQFAYRRLAGLSLVHPALHIFAIQARTHIRRTSTSILSFIYQKHATGEQMATDNLHHLINLHYNTSQRYWNGKGVEPYVPYLEEAIHSLLEYFLSKFCFTSDQRDISVSIPIMLYRMIAAPALGLAGQPSAVFQHTDGTVLVLIQSWRDPHNDMEKMAVQAAIYNQILTSKFSEFFYVNYQSSEIVHRSVTPGDVTLLDQTLSDLEEQYLEGDFPRSAAPPCGSCEFFSLCEAGHKVIY
ncbi:MAG: hypothetical protein ACFFFG_08210 [Candidatus Thorarchaeota archaeon]